MKSRWARDMASSHKQLVFKVISQSHTSASNRNLLRYVARADQEEKIHAENSNGEIIISLAENVEKRAKQIWGYKFQ